MQFQKQYAQLSEKTIENSKHTQHMRIPDVLIKPDIKRFVKMYNNATHFTNNYFYLENTDFLQLKMLFLTF